MSYEAEEKIRLSVDDVVWRDVGDELVVLELSTTTYLTLNGTAKDLWESVAGTTTVAALIELLVERYEITPELAGTDVAEFLAALDERNLLDRDG
jgi:coenzyme PQQ synthesis protein D (PqqD)